MPTVADELIVKLSLDGSGMEKGAATAEKGVEKLKKGTNEAGESAKKAGKDGADAFAAFRREAVGALALFTGGKSLAGFTKDITDANTALGNLSQQLGIAPQKLTQLHYAMSSLGGNPASVDSFLKNIQAKSSDPQGLSQLSMLSPVLGVNFLDAHNRLRGDIIEQLNGSKAFRSSPRAVQENYVSQLGGSSDITMMANSGDLPHRMSIFANKGPTNEQIEQARQLREDWTQLQAETSQIMQKAFSDVEPTLHNFAQALISLEKTHPEEIAHGIEAVATALTALSAVLTARGFASMLKMAAGIKGGAAGGGVLGAAKSLGRATGAGVAAWGADAFFQSNFSHRITNSIAEGEEYAKQTWGLNKTLNDLLQRDIDRRHELINSDGGLLSAAGVAVKEWVDIIGTGTNALLGSTSLSTGNQPAGEHRGERNHNLGNLRFAHQHGASPEDPNNLKSTFAVFKNDEEGLTALKKQLELYNGRDHLDTVSSIISTYAPKKDHNKTEDYIKFVSRRLHVNPNEHMGRLSSQRMNDLMDAIIRQENSGRDRAPDLVRRIAGLSGTASSASTQNTAHTTNNTTHAPVVNVSVQGSNAHPHEIAHAVKKAISQNVGHNNRTKLG